MACSLALILQDFLQTYHCSQYAIHLSVDLVECSGLRK